MTTPPLLFELVLRLARLAETEGWAQGLNPAQAAALDYLGRANRFSRAPSHLADWLGTTRGTVSQTLKALASKGLVTEAASPRDRRSISYTLTQTGRAHLDRPSALADAAARLSPESAAAAETALTDLLRVLLARRGQRAFGICGTCRHHRPNPDRSATCALLSVPLAPEETSLLCIEHAA